MTRQQFSLFQTPIDLAHMYWKQLLTPGSCVVDATCGNGYDTLALSQMVLSEKRDGCVIAIDKQQQALDAARQLLAIHLPNKKLSHIFFYQQCHSSFPNQIAKESVSLIVYNLGYLPGGDKHLTTLSATTIQSLEAALPLIMPGGAVSVTCYPGHDTGKLEEEAVLKFASTLDPQQWSCCHHRWVNRRNAPSLLLIQRCFGSLPTERIHLDNPKPL